MVGSPPCQATTTSDGAGVGLQQLADVRLLQVLGHPEPAAGVEHLLGQEEAVLTVQVAHRTGRLDHHVEQSLGCGHGEARAGGGRGFSHRQPLGIGPRVTDWVPLLGRRGAGHLLELYCRAMAARISISLSTISSPDTSTVTECSVPVKRYGEG